MQKFVIDPSLLLKFLFLEKKKYKNWSFAFKWLWKKKQLRVIGVCLFGSIVTEKRKTGSAWSEKCTLYKVDQCYNAGPHFDTGWFPADTYNDLCIIIYYCIYNLFLYFLTV